MGDVGEKVCFQRLDAAQLRHHSVKVLNHGVQIVYLIRRVDGGNKDGEIPVCHLLGGLGQHLHGPLVGIFDDTHRKQGQSGRYQRPIDNGHDCLYKFAPLQDIHPDNQAHVHSRSQQHPAENNAKQQQWEAAGTHRPPGTAALPAHFSTAL